MGRTRIRRGAAPLDSGRIVVVPHAGPRECPDCGTGLELQWVCERCGSRYGVPDTPEPGSPCGCQLIIENVRPNRPIIGPSVRVGNVMVRIVWCEVHRDAPETARELQAFRARQANEHEACARLLAKARDECEERDRRLAEVEAALVEERMGRALLAKATDRATTTEAERDALKAELKRLRANAIRWMHRAWGRGDMHLGDSIEGVLQPIAPGESRAALGEVADTGHGDDRPAEEGALNPTGTSPPGAGGPTVEGGTSLVSPGTPPPETSAALAPGNDPMTTHRCERIASMFCAEGREWWVGRLLSPIEGHPSETHCMHIRTPYKSVILGLNSADFTQLAVLCQVMHGTPISPSWLGAMVVILRGRTSPTGTPPPELSAAIKQVPLGVQIPQDLSCRYCGTKKGDIYLVLKDRAVEGFCLPCYEKYLDDKRKVKVPATPPPASPDLLEAARALWDAAKVSRPRLSLWCDLHDAILAAEEARRAGAPPPVAAPAEKFCPHCEGDGRCCPHSTTCAKICPQCNGTGTAPHDSGSARGAGEGGESGRARPPVVTQGPKANLPTSREATLSPEQPPPETPAPTSEAPGGEGGDGR